MLAAVGYRAEDDYSDNRWSIGDIRIFRVTDDFPRIAGMRLPAGISSVRYSLMLRECERFAIEESELSKAVGVACGH